MKHKSIMVTERGIAAQGMDRTEVMSMLLYAYLSIWAEENENIDIVDAAMRIIDMLSDMGEEPSIFDMLFGDDDEEGNG